MKKVLFSLFLFSAMAVGVQAQSSSCAKSCKAKPAGTTASCDSKSSSADANAAAAKLASTDASIEAKTCPVSGTVSYTKKVSEKNGSVSYVDVSYDAASNSFVNVSPVKGADKGASCGPKNTSGSGKSCGSGSATATSGSKSPACCAGKGKSASATTTTTTTTTTTPSKAAPTKG